jgi:hypothetical protein
MGVQAIGKKARTTFLPRKSLKVTVLSRWLPRTKSGAGIPTLRFMNNSSYERPVRARQAPEAVQAGSPANISVRIIRINHKKQVWSIGNPGLFWGERPEEKT